MVLLVESQLNWNWRRHHADQHLHDAAEERNDNDFLGELLHARVGFLEHLASPVPAQLDALLGRHLLLLKLRHVRLHRLEDRLARNGEKEKDVEQHLVRGERERERKS